MIETMNFHMAAPTKGENIFWNVWPALIVGNDMMRYQRDISDSARPARVTVPLENESAQRLPLLGVTTPIDATFPPIIIRTTYLGDKFRRFWATFGRLTDFAISFFSKNLIRATCGYFLACLFRHFSRAQLFFCGLARWDSLVPCYLSHMGLAYLLFGFFRMGYMVSLRGRRFVPQRIAVMLPPLKMHDAVPVGVPPPVATVYHALLFWFSHTFTIPLGLELRNYDGTTVFTNQANRPTITTGAFTDLANVPDVVALAINHYLTVDLDAVGATVAGANLVVQIEVTIP